MRLLRLLAIFVLGGVVVGIVSVSQFLAAAPAQPAPTSTYILGPEDVIEINVWTEAGLTRTVTVRPDGMISLPPIGEIKAAGVTPVDLARTVRSALQRYVRKPIVTVVIVKEKGKRVSILGQVKNPGQYVLREQSRLAEAISVAGGPTFAADLGSVTVTGGDPGRDRVLRINLERVLRGDDRDSNVLLQPDDVVFVPGTLRQGLESLRNISPNVQIQIQLPGQGP